MSGRRLSRRRDGVECEGGKEPRPWPARSPTMATRPIAPRVSDIDPQGALARSSTAATKATVPDGPKLGHGPKAEKRPPPGALSPTVANLRQTARIRNQQRFGRDARSEMRDKGDVVLVIDCGPFRKAHQHRAAGPDLRRAPTKRRSSRAPATKISTQYCPMLNDRGEGDLPPCC